MNTEKFSVSLLWNTCQCAINIKWLTIQKPNPVPAQREKVSIDLIRLKNLTQARV